MSEKVSPLYPAYIIDGERQAAAPWQILDSVSVFPQESVCDGEDCPAVVDETPDVSPSSDAPDARKVEKYLNSVLRAERRFPMQFAGSYTRGRIAWALLDCIWRMGRFRIGDLALDACWHWNSLQIGNMAGFYRSVEAMGDMLDALNLKLRDYSCKDTDGPCSLELGCELSPLAGESDIVEQPFTTANPQMGAGSISNSLQNDMQSWLVYIPFDSSPYRLGGSLLAQSQGINSPVAPALDDADYFLDCYEVVRELVEDGIVLAGATVGEGGLIAAVKGMTNSKTGVNIDISDIRRACPGTDIVSILFAEIPGVLIQIRDIDFDYVDAELLLQDVAFYPLGHPIANGGEVRVHSSAKTGLQNILESLVQRQGGEGED